MIVQLWNTNTPGIVSRDTDLTETWCIFKSIWEWEFMYFAGKVVYLIVPASVQFRHKWLKQLELVDLFFHLFYCLESDATTAYLMWGKVFSVGGIMVIEVIILIFYYISWNLVWLLQLWLGQIESGNNIQITKLY